ncbi:uncharacterized protein [Eurosta solidaginis]|uniref:uncharacterized protein n=1 Tax=Eurosta solidaginis TaxID=178769 RepID=UPI0035308332
MKSSHLSEIVPKSLLGNRIVFEHNLRLWQISQGYDSECHSGSTQSISNSFCDAVDDVNEIPILDVLKSRSGGAVLLKSYEIYKKLSEPQRKIITSSICAYILDNKIAARTKLFKNISKRLVVIFPTETKDTYFLHRKGRKLGGSLYAKYHNALYRLRKDSFKENEQPQINSQTVMQTTVECEENKLWLLYNIAPNDEVVQKWQHCFISRTQFFKSAASISDILAEWPILKQSFGYCLVNIDSDFANIYEQKQNLLLENWDSFVEKVTPILKRTIKDPFTLAFLHKIDSENLEKDIRDIIICLSLPALLKPKNRNCKKKTTISNSRDSFLCYATSRLELQQKINSITDEVYGQNIKLQPFLCAIGDDIIDLKEFYVYFAGIYYKLSNIVKSIDICFKIFHVLDLKYPQNCEQIWNFVDQLFFKISNTKDSFISTIINDLQ